jgi:hypothetical protein
MTTPFSALHVARLNLQGVVAFCGVTNEYTQPPRPTHLAAQSVTSPLGFSSEAAR